MKERVIFARNERLLDNEFPVTYDTLMRFKMHMKFIGLSERHRNRMIQRMRTFMGHYSKTSRQAFDEHSEQLMINHTEMNQFRAAYYKYIRYMLGIDKAPAIQKDEEEEGKITNLGKYEAMRNRLRRRFKGIPDIVINVYALMFPPDIDYRKTNFQQVESDVWQFEGDEIQYRIQAMDKNRCKIVAYHKDTGKQWMCRQYRTQKDSNVLILDGAL